MIREFTERCLDMGLSKTTVTDPMIVESIFRDGYVLVVQDREPPKSQNWAIFNPNWKLGDALYAMGESGFTLGT